MASSNPAIIMRLDIPPFNDIRVRKALSMAIDREAIKNGLYKGDAEVFNWPVEQLLKLWYVPLDQYPESSRELFEYHPDKAKQLLAEAGYADGLQTTLTTLSAYEDRDAIIVADWAKIGVKAEIQVKEQAVYTGMTVGAKRTYPGACDRNVNSDAPREFYMFRTGLPENCGNVSNPIIDKYYSDVTAAYFEPAKVAQLVKESSLYCVAQSYIIFLPTPQVRIFWQPWVKGYNGERIIGWCNVDGEYLYSWIDQNLKNKMKK